MVINLIDCQDEWDAMRIITVAMHQIWDETLAVLCPTLNDRCDVIPPEYVSAVFDSPAYLMLERIERRLKESWLD